MATPNLSSKEYFNLNKIPTVTPYSIIEKEPRSEETGLSPEDELKKFEKQGNYLSVLTRDLLSRAGITTGMQVLDVSAGAGDVSMEVARLIGPTGRIVAIERSREAVLQTRRRFELQGIQHIAIYEGDESLIPKISNGHRFDAVVGRLVLTQQKQLDTVLSKFAAFARPGGILAFHEIHISAHHLFTVTLPLMEKVMDLILQTFLRSGILPDRGNRMRHAFDSLGITHQRLLLHGKLKSGPDSMAYDFISRTFASLYPIMQQHGLVQPHSFSLETLAQDLREEAIQAHSFFVPVFFSGISGRTPKG